MDGNRIGTPARAVTPARLLTRHMLWAPLLALPLAVAMGAAGLDRLATVRAIADGVEVTGTVTHLSRGSVLSRMSNPALGSRTWVVSYRFDSVEGAAPVEGRAAIPSEVFDTLELGGPIALRHMARAPARNDAVGSITLRHGLGMRGSRWCCAARAS